MHTAIMRIQANIQFITPPQDEVAAGLQPSVESRKAGTRPSLYSPAIITQPPLTKVITQYPQYNSFIIARVPAKVEGKYQVTLPLYYPQWERYTFTDKLNKLILTNVSSISIKLPMAIAGVDIINCTNITIQLQHSTHIRIEYCIDINIKGPADIRVMRCDGIKHNDALMPVGIYSVDPSFISNYH